MSANVDRMAYVGEVPWHGQGTYLGDNEVTAEKMLAAAGLDWEVALRPIAAVMDEGVSQEIPHRVAVVRGDTRAVLGVVSTRYSPLQNAEAFGFFDEVVGEGQAVYHTAGALGAGEYVWILVKLPGSVKVAGKDQIDNYVVLCNAHDGKFALRMFWTPIRVVCQNTLNLAMTDTTSGYRLSHFRSLRARLSADDARRAIGLAGDALTDLATVSDELVQRTMTDEQLEGFLQRLVPMPKHLALPAPQRATLMLPEPKRDAVASEFQFVFSRRDAIRELTQTGKGNAEFKGTRWAALNGAVEYADYVYGSDAKRAKALLFGYGKELKQDAFNLLHNTDDLFRRKGR